MALANNKIMFLLYSENLKKIVIITLIISVYIQNNVTECQKTTETVIKLSTEETLQPFKDQMTTFLADAVKRINEQTKKLQESTDIFIKTLKFYKFQPKSGPLSDVTPGQFFELWAPFTNDFRDIWKKEIHMLNNEL